MATTQTNQTGTNVEHTPAMAGVESEAPKKRSKTFLIVLILLVVVGGFFGIKTYIHGLHHEETDDAQIDANISPVIPRISGYVTEVRVKDNQQVKAGDTLVILDNRNEIIAEAQAEAALNAAQSNLSVAQASTQASQVGIGTYKANVNTVDAQIAEAKISLWRATNDYNRYANLIKDHSITQQQFEQAQAAKETAQQQLQVLNDQRTAANQQTSTATSQSNATGQQVSVANATIKQRQAEVDNAKLNLSYTVIVAPEDGYTSKVNVEVGQFLQIGQSLFSVVPNTAPWVVANFKETQIDKMKEGQKVIVHVDAYPGHDFEAKLTSFSPATGARFSLLPPDNASGNFVKVVQRLPVKIQFTNLNDQLVKNLRPGMNVDVDVYLD
jgi:membrane fusion protein (multidrug efflux system)